MVNKTSEDFERNRNRQMAKMRSVMDYVFGLLFMIAGAFSLARFTDDSLMIGFGVVALLYGIWRIYRGYKKTSA